MKQATIRSVCECQSKLEAVLDENRHVLAAYAIGSDGDREIAPAHSIEAQNKRFDVGWLCNICGRNTLRSFDADGLVWRDVDPPAVVAQAPVVVPPAPRVPAPPVASSAPVASSSPPPNAATAVALKSLTSPSKPPSVPPKAPSNPPGPPKT